MRSVWPGRNTSPAEVTNISAHGSWLCIDERELFVPFPHFPWFREASIGHIANVPLPSPRHLSWPDLDIDLAVESIEHPERYRSSAKHRLLHGRRPDVRDRRPSRRDGGGSRVQEGVRCDRTSPLRFDSHRTTLSRFGTAPSRHGTPSCRVRQIAVSPPQRSGRFLVPWTRIPIHGWSA
jgi:hypothetical protein